MKIQFSGFLLEYSIRTIAILIVPLIKNGRPILKFSFVHANMLIISEDQHLYFLYVHFDFHYFINET